MGREKTCSIMISRTCYILAIACLAGCSNKPHLLAVGSKNFTEQVLLGEMIAQHLEHRLGQKVDRKLNLGGTLLAHQALLSKEIDLYPEYTGTALTAIFKREASPDPGIVFERVRREYKEQSHIELLDPLGFNNTFVMAIRGEDARAKHLKTISDASSESWVLGVGYEFSERPDGFGALTRAYKMQWKSAPKTMDLGLLYQALAQKEVSMAAANSTDGLLEARDFKTLVDDKKAFPPYQACIAVRADALAAHPSLRKALEELSGKIGDATMRKLNYQVDGEHRPIREVAANFLQQAGLR